MKENIFEVLMYLMENYIDQDASRDPERHEIETRLLEAGFGDNEVIQAFDWLDQLSDIESGAELESEALRVYRDDERDFLGTEGVGFLYRLEQVGVLKPAAREQVVDRFMALNAPHRDLDQLKWVVLMVLFNHPGQDAINFAWLEELIYDERPLSVH